MKFVAAHDLLNVKGLSIMPDTTQPFEWPDGMHNWPDKKKMPGMINKGMRFSIGTSEKQEDLAPDEKAKILWLVKGHARSVQAVAADDKAVARIDREVKEGIAKYQAEIAAAKPMSMPEMISQAAAQAAAMVVKTLTEAGVIKAK